MLSIPENFDTEYQKCMSSFPRVYSNCLADVATQGSVDHS